MKNFLAILLMVLCLSGCANLNWWGRWGSNTVTVRKGDTLYSISRSYGVPIKDLINANRLSAPYTLYVGQKLRLPIKQYHVVKRGESLYSIARTYNVDITTLSKVNKLQTPYSLSVGQKLLLPASVSSTPATTAYSSSAAKNATSKTAQTTSSTKQNYTSNASVPTNAPVKYRSGKFLWPVKGTVISGYGNLGSGRKNDGINIKAALGTAVLAGDAGTVAYAGNELKGFGNLILIKHADGWITAYAHNDKMFVKKGQKVKRGEKIATVGSTGSVTSPQLHFEVRTGKKAVNPRAYLP
ncbi:MAG: peptidoglycan DD-metalloendopeptidase family protein [Alphaproteobacteria bacterium]|nr:peptidoglycan DD-metalloendopeptidase family protein [Alphaproteobacteria bacterium]